MEIIFASITKFFDLPSLMLTVTGSTLPVLVTRGKEKTQFLEGIRRLALPVGIFVSTVGSSTPMITT